MVLLINKRTPPPPRQGTFNHRSITLGPLIAAFASALLFKACDSPAVENPPVLTTPVTPTTPVNPTTFTTTVTGTVTALSPGESSSIDLPRATVSALTTPPNPANRPVTSRPDGSFTLQVKHSGSFRIKVEHPCSEPFTGAAVTASAHGSHDAGALKLTLKPEPAGTARYSITPRTAGGFKLTVNNCVREIRNNEFGATGTIISAKARTEGVSSRLLITEISLPPTLTHVGNNGLARHTKLSEPLTIPRNVAAVGNKAFKDVGNASTTRRPTFSLAADSKLKSIGSQAFENVHLHDFILPGTLETIGRLAFNGVNFVLTSSNKSLVIPAKVSKIGERAFAFITGITTVDIRSRQLEKPASAAPADFPLQPNLFQSSGFTGIIGSTTITGITEIKLPADVYNSCNATQRSAIFGTITLTQVP